MVLLIVVGEVFCCFCNYVFVLIVINVGMFCGRCLCLFFLSVCGGYGVVCWIVFLDVFFIFI